MEKIYSAVLALLFGFCVPAFSQLIVEKNYYASHQELGGEAVITKCEKKADGEKAVTSFEVEVRRSGMYYISFWLCPARLGNGGFVNYEVAVNGSILGEKLTPTSGGWQCVSLPDRIMAELNEGKNTIAVIGKIPDIPNVEHVRVALTKEKSLIDSSEYDKFKANIVKESHANADKNAVISMTADSDTISGNTSLLTRSTSVNYDDPLYNYTYRIGIDFQYTFYTWLVLIKDEQVNLQTTGIDNFRHVLELFRSFSPEDCSWSAVSDISCTASLNVTIPHSGLYYVRVRSYSNARSGLCNLNVNGVNHYDSIPLYSSGVRCLQDTMMVYNTFTCHSTSDPRLWIEEGADIPGTIAALNDDYGTHGDFFWDKNARIKKQYSRPVHAALLSAYGSYHPAGKCDLYIKCPDSNAMSGFTNLQSDDAIQSSPSSGIYNCISWSGGITSYWEWPPSYASSFYSPDELTAFDNFYASRGLTRVGATEDNSVVDLWAYVDDYGNRNYSHGSVRKGADGNAHGYDWESKPGGQMRTFHPRYALGGDTGYGEVVEHYIRTTTDNTATLEEEIANGTARIEYVDFDEQEREIISQEIGKIDKWTISQFNKLYSRWKAVTHVTIFSNPKKIADCQEYKDVLEFCKSKPEVIYVLYHRLANGDGISATELIGDLTFDEHLSLMEKVRNGNMQKVGQDGIKTIRPMLSNYVAYVKELLSMKHPELLRNSRSYDEASGISYSNFAEYDMAWSADGLTVRFTLDKSAEVSLNLVDLKGNFVCSAVNKKILGKGTHSYCLTLEKNRQYLVQLVIDGRVNVKKIMVN